MTDRVPASYIIRSDKEVEALRGWGVRPGQAASV